MLPHRLLYLPNHPFVDCLVEAVRKTPDRALLRRLWPEHSGRGIRISAGSIHGQHRRRR
ncbi:hypothetical protein METHP14_1190009 [Pseudomonas sp. P14-2025]